jgi:hypothetical protein
MISPELQAKLDYWRQESSRRKLTIEELREAVANLRGERKSAGTASTTKRSSSKAPARSASDLLGELGSL